MRNGWRRRRAFHDGEGRADGGRPRDVCCVPISGVLMSGWGTMICRNRAGVEPQVEDMTEASTPIWPTLALQSDDGHALCAKRLQETLRHGADAGQVAGAAVTTPG